MAVLKFEMAMSTQALINKQAPKKALISFKQILMGTYVKARNRMTEIFATSEG